MVETTVKLLLVKLSGKESVSNEDELQTDLMLDSLNMVTMLIDIEEAFAIQLQEDDMNPYDLRTVNDVIQLAKKYIGVERAASFF